MLPIFLSVRAEILLRRKQGWGKINDMSYISPLRYVFSEPFVSTRGPASARVQRRVCLSVSSSHSPACVYHYNPAFLSLRLSRSPHVAVLASRLSAAVSHEAAVHSVWWSFPWLPSCMSIFLSEEAALLTDGNVISWPPDPEVAAMQPRLRAGWYVKCVPDSLSTNT